MKAIILISIAIFLVACDKEYFPSENDNRDENLYGTWVSLERLRVVAGGYDVLSLRVFTNEGYSGITYYIKNNNEYMSLDGIWHVEKADKTNNLRYSRVFEQKRFRNGIYKNTFEYYLSSKKDTLFRKQLFISESKWDTLIKYKYQLKYDGPDYVGLQSTK